MEESPIDICEEVKKAKSISKISKVYKEAEIGLIISKIAKGLKEERQYQGLSQNMVGRAVGVSYSQWQKYESGENAISIKKLILFCKFVHMDITEFFNKYVNEKDNMLEEVLWGKLCGKQDEIDKLLLEIEGLKK